MEGFDSLHEQLETHKKNLKNVDQSIKRLNGAEGELNINISRSGVARKVSLNDDNRNFKRKTYEDQRDSTNKKHANVDSGAEDDDGIKPTIKSSVVSSAMPIKNKEDLIKLQNKGVSQQRNKRIFGHLLGTLSQFKTDDKVRSSTTQAIHRKELEKKIEIQKVEEKKKHSDEKKKLEEEKYKTQKNVEILEAKIRLAQEFEQWKTHQLRYKNFIRTKSRPYIFYLPKILDDKTQKLLAETAALIDEKIAKKLRETETELEILTMKSAKLNNEETMLAIKVVTTENKENKENNESIEQAESEDEMDEEKNNINVAIGEEDDEESETKIESEPDAVVEPSPQAESEEIKQADETETKPENQEEN